MRTEQNAAALTDLEREASSGTERVQQLETALVVCQEELRVCVNQMDELKVRHDQELKAKADQVSIKFCLNLNTKMPKPNTCTANPDLTL